MEQNLASLRPLGEGRFVSFACLRLPTPRSGPSCTDTVLLSFPLLTSRSHADPSSPLPQARGIDVQQVSLVINYDLPTNRENYIHR